MCKPTLGYGSLMVLLGVLSLVSVACSNNKNTGSIVEQTAKAVPTPATQKLLATSKKSVTPPQNEQPTTYEKAIDIATGANNIGRSAVSREDWSLAANRWQEAIALLKAVPASSSRYATSQKKLSEYRGYLADAQLRSTPQPPKLSCSDTNPAFFSIPIKDRMNRTPVVEVNFNNQQKFAMLFDTGASNTLITRSMAATLRLVPVGFGQAAIADGSVVTVPIVKLKSAEIDGRLKRDLTVAVAPSAMPIGLLGQDFYKGYNVTITDARIEFRRRGNSEKTQKKPCLLDTNPDFFKVLIKERVKGIPVVEATFNNNHKFPMLFDTGASRTLITRLMAIKMKMKPVGITQVGIADGSIVTLPIAVVESNAINGRIKRDVLVAVAPPEMEIGLLGQDFFEGYDVTIKDNVIEFRRQRENY